MTADFPRPNASDEHRHSLGSEELFNESWYFDAVSEDGGLGVWIRLGLYPNLGLSWCTTYITGPDRPAVAVVDYEAPLPEGDGLAIATDAFEADHVCERELERFSVRLKGTGQAYPDHAEPLYAGAAGAPADVELDLTWDTAGVPYSYSVLTRYEVPCTVSGTVRVDGEELELNTSAGQRDHSWGLRDWWAADWMWSAARLDDGSRLHAVHLQPFEGEGFGVGYTQPAGGQPAELEGVERDQDVGANGLITSARIAPLPDGPELNVEPLAFGALRLVSPDGRVSQFPRAMCRMSTQDGRSGLGWVEWNRNQR